MATLIKFYFVNTHIDKIFSEMYFCKISCLELYLYRGFPGNTSSEESACRCRRREAGSIPRLGRCPAVANDNLLQYSCLENSMGREASWATVHGAANSWT